jgi:hypothetical protein
MGPVPEQAETSKEMEHFQRINGTLSEQAETSKELEHFQE